MHVKNIGTERLPYMHNLLIICCCATNYSHYVGLQAIEIFTAHSFSRSEIQEQPFGWFCLRGSPEGAGSHVLLFPPSVPQPAPQGLSAAAFSSQLRGLLHRAS